MKYSTPKMTSQICLDVSAALQQSAGIGRYTRQLSTALVGLDGAAVSAGRQYRIFYNRPQPSKKINEADLLLRLPPALTALPASPVYASNKAWRIRLQLAYRRPWPAANKSFEELVFGGGTGPVPQLFHGMDFICPPLRRATSIITIHDLSFLLYPQHHARLNRLNLRTLLPYCVRQASRIIAVSQNTRRDVLKLLGPQLAGKTEVIYPGIDSSFFEPVALETQQATLDSYGIDHTRPFILAVGTLEPRKNQARLLEAYRQVLREWPDSPARPQLVLVGKAGWGGEYDRVRAGALQGGLSFASRDNPAKNYTSAADIIHLNQVEDDVSLRALYAAAALAVYPSLYEGFGLPALEAMAAGVPLVTSNNSSLPEITGPDGQAALLIDPTSIGALTVAIRRLLLDPELPARLRRVGPVRASAFSWKKAAQATLEIYNAALNNK